MSPERSTVFLRLIEDKHQLWTITDYINGIEGLAAEINNMEEAISITGVLQEIVTTIGDLFEEGMISKKDQVRKETDSPQRVEFFIAHQRSN